jgi:hypothetical protein
MKFPILNISDKKWKDDEDITVYWQFDEYWYSPNEDILRTYLYGKTFCDCHGNLFVATQIIPPTSFLRNTIKFLPMVYKCEIVFKPLNEQMPLEDLRQFMFDRISELGQDNFTNKWKEQIKNAKNHSEIIDCIVD